MSIDAKKKPISQSPIFGRSPVGAGKVKLGSSALRHAHDGKLTAQRDYTVNLNTDNVRVAFDGIEAGLLVTNAELQVMAEEYAFDFRPPVGDAQVELVGMAPAKRLKELKKLPGFGIWADKKKDALEIEGELRGEWA